MKNENLDERLVSFSAQVIQLSKKLEKSYTGNYLSNQIVRSAISPTLNYGESQSAESLKDFIHKLKISLKELRETYFALKIIIRANLIERDQDIARLLNECNELISIFVASIKTCQKKLNQQKSR